MKPRPTDQREHLRYEVLDYASLEVTADEVVSAIITDVSPGGIQLRARQLVDRGSRLNIQIGRNGEAPLKTIGEVRHVSAVPDSDLFIIGLRFRPETGAECREIAEYVHAAFIRQCDLHGM